MKIKDIFKLYKGLRGIPNLEGESFTYAMNKNKRLIQTEVDETLSTLKKEFPEYYKYLAEAKDLVDSLQIEKDDKKKIETRKKLDELDIKNKEVSGKFNKRETEIVNKDSKAKLHKIKLSVVPKNITETQMDGIFDLIEEETKSKVDNKK